MKGVVEEGSASEEQDEESASVPEIESSSGSPDENGLPDIAPQKAGKKRKNRRSKKTQENSHSDDGFDAKPNFDEQDDFVDELGDGGEKVEVEQYGKIVKKNTKRKGKKKKQIFDDEPNPIDVNGDEGFFGGPQSQ